MRVSPIRRAPARPLHNRLAVLRAERRLSRAELAELVDVNPQTIGSLERGDYYPSLDLAMQLAEVFGCRWRRCSAAHPFVPLSEQVYRTDGGSRA
jgi:DNA-binding XRE family transcriptional regulator